MDSPIEFVSPETVNEVKQIGTCKTLVSSKNEVLKTITSLFDFKEPPTDPIQLAFDLVTTMRINRGLGLAAPQVGLPYRAFAMDAQPALVLFNPSVIDVYGSEEFMEEGCLTFKGCFMKIKRPTGIKVRYTEPNGNIVTKKMEGITARVFLHELDHLDGILFTERASFMQIGRMKKQQLQYEKMKKGMLKFNQGPSK